jgi:lipopolysaccharide transport system permease protein
MTTDERTRTEWDLKIRPQSSLFSLNLSELWHYKDLLFLLVKRDFISFYKQTVLGPVWFFVQPLLTTFIYVFVFGNLAGLSSDGMPPPVFYMSGVVAWNYFAECLIKTSTVFRDNANIFGKVYFPRLIMPLSIVASNLVRFAVQLLLLVATIIYFAWFKGFPVQTGAHLLLFPVMVLFMAMLGLGLGMLISAMTTKYRDLAYLVAFGVQLLMYATPVIYPLTSVPEKVGRVIEYNPMTPIIEGIRYSLLGRGSLTVSSFLYAFASSMLILALGTFVFNKVEKDFIDSV